MLEEKKIKEMDKESMLGRKLVAIIGINRVLGMSCVLTFVANKLSNCYITANKQSLAPL